jgi:hypothetical protein
VELWSGKQVFGVLLNPIKAAPVLINLEGKSNTYSGKVRADHRNVGPIPLPVRRDGAWALFFFL